MVREKNEHDYHIDIEPIIHAPKTPLRIIILTVKPSYIIYEASAERRAVVATNTGVGRIQ